MVVGSLFFNANLIDKFYEYDDSETEIYAHDTTPYNWAPDNDAVISKLHLISFLLGPKITIWKPILKNAISCLFQKN